MRRDFSYLPPLISILLLFSALSYGQAWSGVLASSRAIDWSKAGLPASVTFPGKSGNLPDGETFPNAWTPPARTQCGSTVNPSGDTSGATDVSHINSAISSCTAAHYVLLAAGHFYLNSCVYLAGTTSITLRGSGAQATMLTLLGGGGCVQIGEASGSVTGTLTSGSNYAAGSTTITVNVSSAPTAGNVAWLDQCDTGTSGNPCSGTQVDNGSVFVCGDTGSGICQYGTGTAATPNHQHQMVLITSVTSLGSNNYNIGISPGLLMPTWTHSQTPTFSWQGTSAIAFGMGIEDLTFDLTDSSNGASTQLASAYGSWIKGVRFIGNPTNRLAAIGPNSLNCLFANNYLFGQNPSSLSSGYVNVFTPDNDTEDLIINNIMQGGTPVLGGGRDTGDVLAYTYARDPETFQYLFEFQHTSESSFFLREGNQMGNSEDDDTWGTHDFNTWFRNYYSCWDPPYLSTSGGQGDPSGIKIDAYARFENAIGNVIGGPLCTVYEGSGNYIFYFGTGDSLNKSTSMRWGNCDTATNTCRFVNSEVPSSLASPNASYSNPVPSSTTLPTSFFMNGLSAHPNGGTGLNWWKVCTSWNTFPTSCNTTQTQPFPTAGPDVTGGPDVNGYAYDIPAAVAYYNLPIDSTYQNSYTVTGSSWSSGTETLTVSGLPNTGHLMGGFQVSGINSACIPPGAINNEMFMTGSSSTTVSYALTSNPGGSCTGTMKFPDVRQFDERVYQTDTGGGDPSVNPPTGLSAVVN